MTFHGKVPRITAAIVCAATVTACSSSGISTTLPVSAAAPFAGQSAEDSDPVETIASGLHGPRSVAFDAKTDDIYVADTKRDAIKRVTSQGATSSIGSGFSWPDGVAVDPETKDVYVADSLHDAVKKVSADGTVSTIATGFKQPWGVTFDAKTKSVYVADTGNAEIKKIAPDGNVKTIARIKTYAIAVDDATGDLYAFDLTFAQLMKIDPNGTTHKMTVHTQLGAVGGIAIDTATKDVYVSQSTRATVLKIAPDGKATCAVRTFDLTTCYESGFLNPFGLALDQRTKAIYVADNGLGKLYKITP